MDWLCDCALGVVLTALLLAGAHPFMHHEPAHPHRFVSIFDE